MGDIVNLRQARKRRGRKDAEAQAAARRVDFGLSKTERTEARRLRDSFSVDLDRARLDKPDDTSPPK